MKHFILFGLLLVAFATITNAQDSLSVLIKLKKAGSQFVIQQEAVLHNFDAYTKMAVLHIEAEHISSGSKYNFKYAILEGYCQPVLIIENNIPEGQYAFTYKIQSDFLKISGRAEGLSKGTKEITYYITNTQKKLEMSKTPVDEKGNFNVGKIIIADNVILGFYGDNKKERRRMSVYLNEPLPKNYYPVDSLTQFLMFNRKNINTPPDSTLIKYFVRRQKGQLTKAEKIATEEIKVVATKKSKSRLQQYEEIYVSSIYEDRSDAITFDGFTNDLLKNASNLQDFIVNNVNGFTYDADADTGDRTIRYRRNIASYIVDGIPVDEFPWFLNSWDIALLRIFKNGNFASTENGTVTVAFFTKRGAFLDNDTKGRISFPIKGFTPINFLWQNRF
jgi:hypothetical protein